MERNKAAFRAIRETLGIPQQDLAKRLDVKPLSVKRWESPKYPQNAPVRVWDMMCSLLEQQRETVADALENAGDSAELPYWACSQDFEDFADADDPAQTWTEANATARAIAQALELEGIDVTWHNAAEDA